MYTSLIAHSSCIIKFRGYHKTTNKEPDMAQATFHFPRGFLWGTATSSHQVEGYNMNNQWWAWEQQPGRIVNGDKSGPACDWWGGRWREDLDRACESGQNAHRFSIEWSRIQPLPDKWDETALDRYREMVRWLHQHNMTPLVTLHHFSDPIWLAEKGGWENEAVVDQFVTYTRKVVDALKEYTNLWVTINEPNVYAVLAYVAGAFPPGKQDLGAAMRVYTNMVRAHAAAYHAIHEIQPTARVGIAQHLRGFFSAHSWLPTDRLAAGFLHYVFNYVYTEALVSGVVRYPGRSVRVPNAKGTQDFIGVNYYTQEAITLNLLHPTRVLDQHSFPAGAEIAESGLIANVPDGMFYWLKWAKKYGLPIIITENGIDGIKDDLRVRYLIQNLHQVWRAVNFNFPVKGYFFWSLVDNFEWERGWNQRFGLWELDLETQARRKRPSADLYAEICRENGISSEMVARYAPELFAKMFPN
jgi:beta-glucosidase